MTAPQGSEGDLDASQAVALVATREIVTRGRSKVFRITTIILLVGIVATVVISNAVHGSKPAEHVGFLPVASASAAPLKSVAKAVGLDVTTATVSSRAAGEQQLRSGKLDALVTGDELGIQVEVKKDINDSLRNALTLVARTTALDLRLRQSGVDPASVNRSIAAAGVDVHSLNPPNAHRSQRLAVGVIAGILVYVALMLYGQMVAQGVVEEKTSRIVELLLAAIRPWQLLLGKVIGIGVLGLGQLILVAVAGVVTGMKTGALSFPARSPRECLSADHLVPARLSRVRADVRRRRRARLAPGRRRRRTSPAHVLIRRALTSSASPLLRTIPAAAVSPVSRSSRSSARP